MPIIAFNSHHCLDADKFVFIMDQLKCLCQMVHHLYEWNFFQVIRFHAVHFLSYVVIACYRGSAAPGAET